MSFIKSRKHATPSLRPLSPSMACLATSIALALPAVAMAADTPATGADDGYLIADAGNTTQLPTIPVEGNSAPSYKVDTLASPKFVKPLVDTTQTITTHYTVSLNADDAFDGILVQSPLPAGMGRDAEQRVFDEEGVDPTALRAELRRVLACTRGGHVDVRESDVAERAAWPTSRRTSTPWRR